MPEKKKQHYVPRFYLKRFSLSDAGKSIGVYNIPASRFIPSAKLKTQAYKDYFYGKDLGGENMLGVIEKYTSVIIENIIKTETVPPRGSEEHRILLRYVVCQRQRTLYAAEQHNEMLDKIFKAAYKDPALAKDQLDGFAAEYKNPTIFPLTSAILNLPIAYDLGVVLIKNHTKSELITSDNPAIGYNQFLESRKIWGGLTGLATKGLQLFLPISPKYAILFLDVDTYSPKIQGDTIHLTSTSDLDALNSLQIINALENVYFNHEVSDSDITTLSKKYSRYRKKEKAHVKEYIGKPDEEGKHSLLHTYTEELRCSLQLSFLRITKEAKAYELGKKSVHVRDEMLCKLHNQFGVLVMDGWYKPTQFEAFLNQIRMDPSFFARHGIRTEPHTPNRLSSGGETFWAKDL